MACRRQATSHYLNLWWLVYRRISVSHGLNYSSLIYVLSLSSQCCTCHIAVNWTALLWHSTVVFELWWHRRIYSFTVKRISSFNKQPLVICTSNFRIRWVFPSIGVECWTLLQETKMMSHERHGVSNYQRHNRLFNCLSGLATWGAPKLHIIDRLWGKSANDRWGSPQKIINVESFFVIVTTSASICSHYVFFCQAIPIINDYSMD